MPLRRTGDNENSTTVGDDKHVSEPHEQKIQIKSGPRFRFNQGIVIDGGGPSETLEEANLKREKQGLPPLKQDEFKAEQREKLKQQISPQLVANNVGGKQWQALPLDLKQDVVLKALELAEKLRESGVKTGKFVSFRLDDLLEAVALDRKQAARDAAAAKDKDANKPEEKTTAAKDKDANAPEEKTAAAKDKDANAPEEKTANGQPAQQKEGAEANDNHANQQNRTAPGASNQSHDQTLQPRTRESESVSR